MRANLHYFTRRGAYACEYGDAAELALKLARAPIGAELVADEGPRAGQVIGHVDECDGGCDKPHRCRAHWWHERGDDIGIPIVTAYTGGPSGLPVAERGGGAPDDGSVAVDPCKGQRRRAQAGVGADVAPPSASPLSGLSALPAGTTGGASASPAERQDGR